MDAEEDAPPLETPAASQARVAQVRALRERAGAGDLRFEAYLPPDLALWVLDLVERGEFSNPSEAAFVLLDQAWDLDPHHDLRRELLSRVLQEAAEGPLLGAEEVRAALEAATEGPRRAGDVAADRVRRRGGP